MKVWGQIRFNNLYHNIIINLRKKFKVKASLPILLVFRRRERGMWKSFVFLINERITYIDVVIVIETGQIHG